MHRRKWILVLAITVSCVVVSLYIIWRVIGIDQKIRAMLLEKAKPFLAQGSDIEKVEMDLVSLHLKGVRLAPKDRSFFVEVEDVRFGYRFGNLLRYGFVPHKLTHQVILSHPKIIIHRLQVENSNGMQDNQIVDLRKLWQEIHPLQRIILSDAEVVLDDTLREPIQLACGLSGWLNTSPLDSAVVRLTGRFFGAEKENVDFQGKIDLLHARPVWFHLQIKESPIPPDYTFLMPEFIHVISGTMRGEGTYNRNKGTHGFYEIENGAFSLQSANILVDNVNVRSVITDTDIELTGTIGDFNGSSLKLSGHIHDFLNPQYDLNMSTRDLSIASFIRSAYPGKDVYVDGKANFDFYLEGFADNPLLKGEVNIEKLAGYGFSFTNVFAGMSLKRNRFDIRGEGIEKSGMRLGLSGQGSLNGRQSSTFINVDLTGQRLPVLPDWFQQNINRYTANIHFQTKGSMDSLQGNTTGEINVLSNEGLLRRYTTTMTLKKKKLKFQVNSNETFSLTGVASQPFTKLADWQIQMAGLQDFFIPFASKKLRQMIYDLGVGAELKKKGDVWDMNFWGEGTESDPEENYFNLYCHLGERTRNTRRFQLTSTYQRQKDKAISMKAGGEISPQGIRLARCDIGEGCVILGYFPFQKNQTYQGLLELTNFRVGQLHDLLPSFSPYHAALSGTIDISGPGSKPEWHVDLSLRKGQFHSIGPFNGDLTFHGNRQAVQAIGVLFEKEGTTLLSGSVSRSAEDSLTGVIKGEDLDLGILSYAFAGDTSRIRGNGSLQLQFEGSSLHPRVVGSLAISNGAFGNVTFRDVWAEFEDIFSDSTGYAGGRFIIKGGWMTRDDDLTLHTWGEIPHGAASDADISVLAKGNILGVLPHVSGFVQKADGTGELFLRWAGTTGEWTLGDCRLRIDQGNLELASFLKHIRNVQAEMSLVQQQRFMKIHHFTGNIEGTELILENEFQIRGQQAEPLSIPQLGIHFGTLKLKTMGKGVRLHIPGLMEPGDDGLIGFSGFNDDGDYFTLAGPNEAPAFGGTLNLYDMRITYPFLVLTDIGPDDPLMTFVEKVDWDLRLKPMQDVHYIRDIESPLGNIYTDLKLRDKYGELHVQGIAQDGTLQVWGNLMSNEGTLEILDHYFRPEQIIFDYPKGATNPILSARAHTTIIDSTGMPATVWLTVSALDVETGLESKAGDWENIQFRFTSDNPNLGRSEADLLAALGYSSENITDRAYDAIGMQVDNLVFRPLLRPIERTIRRHLGLDVVRFSSMFSRNLVQLRNMNELGFDPRMLFRSSKVVLGKYIAPGLFLTYSGQVQNGPGFRYHTHGLGFRHALVMDYSIRPDLFLEMEYTYDSQLLSDRREDKRIWIRHIFPF